MNTAEIQYDFKNAKSLKVYPKKDRPVTSNTASIEEKRALKALNASEKEVKHLMEVANRRLERVSDLVNENIVSGQHLIEEIFIPEYLGFTESPPEKDDEVRIYSKEGFSITRIEGGKWLLCGHSNMRTYINIPNMYQAIIVLGSIGLNLTMDDYIAGKYSTERPLGEIVDEVVQKVMDDRQEGGQIE